MPFSELVIDSQRPRQVTECSGIRSFISLIATVSDSSSSSKKLSTSFSCGSSSPAGRFGGTLSERSSFSSSASVVFAS